MAAEGKTKRRRRSRAQWGSVFARFEASGLGVEAFCDREGVSDSSFRRWRGLLAASRARDSYGFLLAVGITCWLAYQSLINIAVITAVMPFTGIPLPFISYGGSSLLISVIGMGILLNISRDAAVTRGRKVKDE